jgi:transcriptional regulator with XRE-family HTH domain
MAAAEDLARLISIEIRRAVLFGEVHKLRAAAQLSMSAVGKACGVSPSIVNAWERGTAEPTASEALRWLETLYRVQPSTPVMQLAGLNTEQAAADSAAEAAAARNGAS